MNTGGKLSKVESALKCFNDGEGFNCSQSVLSAYAGQMGLDHELALKISTGFGGGMGRKGEVCGAVTGALMVIGLTHGRTAIEDTGSKERTYELVGEFINRFKSRNGSILCRELLGYDIGTPKGYAAAKEQKVFSEICPTMVQAAAEILEDIL